MHTHYRLYRGRNINHQIPLAATSKKLRGKHVKVKVIEIRSTRSPQNFKPVLQEMGGVNKWVVTAGIIMCILMTILFTVFFSTMNISEEMMKEYHYSVHLGSNENYLTRMFGQQAETLCCFETLLFEDYDKVVFNYFDTEVRRQTSSKGYGL